MALRCDLSPGFLFFFRGPLRARGDALYDSDLGSRIGETRLGSYA